MAAIDNLIKLYNGKLRVNQDSIPLINSGLIPYDVAVHFVKLSLPLQSLFLPFAINCRPERMEIIVEAHTPKPTPKVSKKKIEAILYRIALLDADLDNPGLSQQLLQFVKDTSKTEIEAVISALQSIKE